VITAGLGAVLSIRTPWIFADTVQDEASKDIASNKNINFILGQKLLFDVFNC
jgi:hypothetical protein